MRSYQEESELWAARKQEIAGRLNKSGLPLVLFGKAPAVDCSFLCRLQVPVQYICDNNPEKHGTALWGLEVISPNQLQDIYSAYNVLILVPFEDQIIPQLQGLPIPPSEIFRLDLYFEEEGSAAYFQQMAPEIETICACLADQESKDTYKRLIRYRINRDPAQIRGIALPRAAQYFPHDLGGRAFLRPDEIFVDAGAFTGDTVECFLAAAEGKFHTVYAFEPEGENYERLLHRVRGNPDIFCKQTAVGDKNGTIRFFSDDSGSKADRDGGEVVCVNTLDSLLRDVPVTFLKMDVEGMECQALRGAKELIRKYHPKLAVCTYHSNADMIRVPQLILEMDPDYRLYFRHYTNALVETVCYAI